MRFSDHCWQVATPIYEAILAHPFLKGLADGSLAKDAFRFYAVQDALYLQDYARGLALLGGKADKDDSVIFFGQQAAGAITVERAMHESFFASWGMTSEDVVKTAKAPNCLLYTDYLMRIALERPYAEGVAAFLPCYWVYMAVGKELMKQGSPNPDYQKWIDMYSGEGFEELVQTVIDLTDKLADKQTDETRQQMLNHFVITTRLEYMFWDMGFQQQEWPV